MSDEQNELQKLQQKLADIQKRQELFQSEILEIRGQIEKFTNKPVRSEPVAEETPVPSTISQVNPDPLNQAGPERKPSVTTPDPGIQEENVRSELERFIGENLINKIGIAVTVIGVGIGTKYAIDHQLISPLVRIILGYLVGSGLLFFAVWLKKQYESFSAVLLSGSMAIMYFITYAAYSFYGFYPQLVAFLLMVAITFLTVTAALQYNREIIAIGGMVGAFAIPFLLSEGSENVMIFFSYIAIINSGILVIAFKKYWKPLYFNAFVLTWAIYFSWYFGSHRSENDFALALVFLFIFFSLFYLTFLSYKLVREEKFDFFDIVLLLLNSFIFYGLGYSILSHHQPGENLLGLFTACNALIHFIVSIAIYRKKLADRNLFYLVSGLVVVFLTIAVPVQLNGNWVTLLWICEAALLFSIGRIRNTPIYEKLSYPLVVISFLSQVQDWHKLQLSAGSVDQVNEFTPLLNIQFLSSLIFVAALLVIILIYYNKKYSSPFNDKQATKELLDYGLPALFILGIYLTFETEIATWYNHLSALAAINGGDPGQKLASGAGINISRFRTIWLCNYSLFFFTVLSVISALLIRQRTLGIAAFWLNLITIIIFLFQGLFILSELRERFISDSSSGNIAVNGYNIAIRYISFVFVAMSLTSLKLWISRNIAENYYVIIFSLLFHLTTLWILCSEMLNIMNLIGTAPSYKFGLSILTGLYALMLIVLGIIGRRQHLRLAAIVLLGATLAKLFFYDITRLDTILKTILFLALGVLMLLMSFLYNKYKVRLFGEHEEGGVREV
jgi:uncharacterized membrane protein